MLKHFSQQPCDRSHHRDISSKGCPLAQDISRNVLFTFADLADQSLVDHHSNDVLSDILFQLVSANK